MADAVNDAELGRSKHSTTPAEHLQHLLKIGWDPRSPIILKFVKLNGLERQLEQLVKEQRQHG